MRENILTLGYVHDAPLADYLREAEMALDKSTPADLCFNIQITGAPTLLKQGSEQTDFRSG